MAEGCRLRGGILGLLDLIEEHRGAVEYDFRTRFPGVTEGLGGVPEQMGWGEAIRQVRILRADPSSMTAAAIEGWDYPMSRIEAILADQYDLSYAKTGAKDRKPYPRPYEVKDETKTRRGNSAGRSREEVEEILRQFGHSFN